MPASKHARPGANTGAKDEPRYVGEPEPGEEIPRAPRGTRYVGFCRSCRDFVEVRPDFSCKRGNHPREDIGVALLVGKDEPLPHLPAINLGALFMPALWGPAHGQWFMILFYPVWLFLDIFIYSSVHGDASPALSVVMGLITAAIMVYYALHANAYGYLRVAAEKTPDEYLAAERKWSVLFVVIGVAFLAFATWYNLAIRPGMAG